MICPSCQTGSEDDAESCFTCGHVFTTVIKHGTLLAHRYEVLSRLGKGGMGTVYKAHDRELDEGVAVKVLRADMSQSPNMAKRFRSEIKLARRVGHRNVCRIFEYGQDGDLRFIAMELIEGVDLKRLLRERGAFPPDEALDIAIQIAEGLEAIHEHGIVHRDLKTPNIMKDARGVVRLMDFGIAKQWESESSNDLTAAGQIVGTPEYMSPEQVRGGKIDSRSDIYALGIVIFELFTGQVPFRGDTPMLTLIRQLHDPPPLEGPLSSRLPKSLIPVLRKALAKDVADRYQSARELVKSLREALRAWVSLPGSLARPLSSATAPELQPEAAAALTLVPTNVPTEVPTLAPKPALGAAPEPAAAKAMPVREETAKPADPTVPVVPGREQGVWDPTHRMEPSVAAQVAPTPVLKTPIALETAVAPLEKPRAQRTPQRSRPATAARLGWLHAVLAVGVVLAVGAAAVLIGQRTPPKSATSTAGVERPRTTLPLASQAIAPSAAAALDEIGRSSASSAGVSVSESVTTPSHVPRPLATLRLARAPESATQREAATKTDRPTMSAAPLTGASSPSALPLLPIRSDTQPTSAETSLAAATPSPSAEPAGLLRLAIRPYADVSVDGKAVGTTPMKPLNLSAGVHTIVLSNPGFQPLNKKVTIELGKTTTLDVDLAFEAFPK